MFDLSLSEIAEIKGVTRQSVADTLKKVRAELDDVEEKLSFVKKKGQITDFAQSLSEDKRQILMSILEE